MITVENASKLLTKQGVFTTEASIKGKLVKGFFDKREMTQDERRFANTKYNFVLDETSFIEYASKYGIELKL